MSRFSVRIELLKVDRKYGILCPLKHGIIPMQVKLFFLRIVKMNNFERNKIPAARLAAQFEIEKMEVRKELIAR